MSSMKARSLVFSTVVLTVLACCGVAGAQDPQAGETEMPAGAGAEEMAAWQQAAAPGSQHQQLATMAGSWTFKGSFWMTPEAPPMESAGTSERKMILDGRVLVEKVKSEWMGETFEGLGMTGYDNVAGTYWGTWVDSMGTGIMMSTGTCNNGTCEFTGTYNDPMVGGPKTVRMTMTVEDDGNREVHQMFDNGPEGEYQTMELVYTRAK